MSGEAVPYHLRQNKHVDRQLFMELLSHTNRVNAVRDSLYISFGGVYFEDFKLIHQAFGAKRLISIEKEDWIVERQRHNRPYGCVRCRKMTSRELVNNIQEIRRRLGKRQLICWLDFADASRRRGQLEDISILTKNAVEFDILRTTMNVNPATLYAPQGRESVEERDRNRLESLRREFSDKIPRNVEMDDVTAEGFASFCRDMVRHEIHRALSSSPGLFFQPLGSYSYADSDHTMLTVTGVFLREEDRLNYISRTKLRDFEFAGLNWEISKINVPLLSQREKLALDQRFGNGKSAAQIASSLRFRVNKKPEDSVSMLESYFTFHRYYPHFHRIQY